MLSSKRPVSDPILGVVVARCSSVLFKVLLKMSKIGLQGSESVPKFEVRMRLAGLY